MTRLSEHERDTRDLGILKLLDDGLSQNQVRARLGVTRGLITKLIKDIRDDEATA